MENGFDSLDKFLVKAKAIVAQKITSIVEHFFNLPDI